MGRGPFYSDDQRESIISAVLEDGLSARQAVDKARLGGLGVAAFEMPASTAQGIVRHARRCGTRDGLSDRLAQGADRLLRVAEQEIEDVEKLREEGDGDHLKARRAADLLSRVQRLVNAMDLSVGPKPPESETDQPAATQTADNDFVRELLEAFERRKAEREQVAQQTDAGHSELDPELRKLADEIRADFYASGESAQPNESGEGGQRRQRLKSSRRRSATSPMRPISTFLVIAAR